MGGSRRIPRLSAEIRSMAASVIIDSRAGFDRASSWPGRGEAWEVTKSAEPAITHRAARMPMLPPVCYLHDVLINEIESFTKFGADRTFGRRMGCSAVTTARNTDNWPESRR